MKISVLQSWRFWQDRYNEKPEGFGGYKFPDSLDAWNRAIDHKDCPFCGTLKILHIKWKEWDGEVLCLCNLLAWLKSKTNVKQPYEVLVEPATLDALIPVGDEKAQKDLARLKAYVSDWYTHLDSWISISGSYGCGKTHVLRAIRTRLPGLSIFIDAASFQQMLFSARLEPTGVKDLIRELSNTPILLFDDIGLEHDNQWTLDVMAAIINNRYRRWRDCLTAVTTNMTYDLMRANTSSALSRIGDRLTDTEVSRIYVLRQASYRDLKQPVLRKAGE